MSGNDAEGSEIGEETSTITIALVGASRRVDDECERKKNEVADFGKPNKRPEGSGFSPNEEVEITVRERSLKQEHRFIQRRNF